MAAAWRQSQPGGRPAALIARPTRTGGEQLRLIAWILWPSFIVGGIGEAVFFALFDPEDLLIHGNPLGWERVTVYSVGFLLFWALAAASSALTCLLQRSSDEINRRCPLEPQDRPADCPRHGVGP